MIDSSLPIYKIIDKLLSTFSTSQNVVLQAEPGAGKSTAIPLELLASPLFKTQKIVMLEPRRMAAKAIANYLAKQLGEPVGKIVGYQVKNEKCLSQSTRLEIVTEGILLKRLQSNPELEGVGLVIFDEFHERTIFSDLSLMLALEAQQIIREDLRLLVMSATLDTNLVSTYLLNAPVIQCEGRIFPVDISYKPQGIGSLEKNVVNALLPIVEKQGTTLVFLPGIGEINRCISLFEATIESPKNIEYLPLHGSLPLAQQEKAITPSSNSFHKVIFSTNIAETSLTISDVTCVIDSGLEKRLNFDPASGMSKLTTIKISKASAEQRKGRAGRVKEGRCIRLWNQEEHQRLKPFQEEEILNVDLSFSVLELARAGHHQFEKINWLTQPPKAHFDSSRDLLIKLNLISPNGKITKLGEEASKIGSHPRFAKMVLAAESALEKEVAICLTVLLSERDVLHDYDSADILIRLHVLIDAICAKQRSVKNVNTNLLKRLVKDYKSLSKTNDYSVFETQSYFVDIVASLLLYAYPERLAQRRKNSSNRFKLANGRGALLNESDPLCGKEYILAIDCDAHRQDGKIFRAVEFSSSLLERKFSTLLEENQEFGLTETQLKPYVKTTWNYGAITIKELVDRSVPKSYLLNCIRALIKQNHTKILNWTPECENWVARVTWLGEHLDNFPSLKLETILEQQEQWLIPYISNVKSINELKKLNIFPLLVSLLSYNESKILEKEAPKYYTAPSGKSVAIDYQQIKGPTVSIKLQEVLGEKSPPKLANFKAPLIFELLSPANRPIQITSDLAQFWSGSYKEVAKEMRAKYPKHRWPEDPANASAGSSLKQRN